MDGAPQDASRKSGRLALFAEFTLRRDELACELFVHAREENASDRRSLRRYL
jgi:hypothetical protein